MGSVEVAEKQRYVYVWNGIIEVGGNDAYYQVHSSRKKAVLYAIDKCERYGHIDPQVEKKPPSLIGYISIIDYQGTFLGIVKRLPVL